MSTAGLVIPGWSSINVFAVILFASLLLCHLQGGNAAFIYHSSVLTIWSGSQDLHLAPLPASRSAFLLLLCCCWYLPSFFLIGQIASAFIFALKSHATFPIFFKFSLTYLKRGFLDFLVLFSLSVSLTFTQSNPQSPPGLFSSSDFE